MKAYLPIQPGWYGVLVASTENEFDHKISDDPDAVIDISDKRYMYTRVRIMKHTGVSIYDVYFKGRREEEDCMSFGGGIRLFSQIDVYKVDWNTIPDWVHYVTVDADGMVKYHNNMPERFATIWGAPMMPQLRFKHKQDQVDKISIPVGVDWRTLIEIRQ